MLTFSMQFARLGLNVVIMSRSKKKLQKVADEISMYTNESITGIHC